MEDRRAAGDAETRRFEGIILRSWQLLTRHRSLLLGLVLPAAVACVELWRFSHFTTDDAYISYRYAENLVQGAGLVYNLGERVEGYTNFLFTLLLAGSYALGCPVDVAAKVIGGASALGVLTLAYLLAGELYRAGSLELAGTEARTAAPFALTPWVLALDSAFLSHSVSGLETGFFTFLVLLGVYALHREYAGPARRAPSPLSAVAFALGALTRPEGVAMFGVALLLLARHREEEDPGARFSRQRWVPGACVALLCLTFYGLHQWRGSPLPGAKGLAAALLALGACGGLLVMAWPLARTRAVWVRVAIVGGAWLAHSLFRVAYYGHWLPNTLEAKTGDIAAQFFTGTTYLLNFWRLWQPLPYLALIGLGAGLWRGQRLPAAAAALSVLGAAYILWVGGDWMPFFRYLVPFIPYFMVLVEAPVQRMLATRVPGFRAGLVLAVLALLLTRREALRHDRRSLLKQHAPFWATLTRSTADWLNSQGRPGAVAIGDIGEVGYRSGRTIFDLLGLVTPAISRLPGGHGSKDLNQLADAFFAAKPEYVVWGAGEHACTRPAHPIHARLHADPRFSREYALRYVTPRAAQENWCVFERR